MFDNFKADFIKYNKGFIAYNNNLNMKKFMNLNNIKLSIVSI